jgi:hypothetical protein
MTKEGAEYLFGCGSPAEGKSSGYLKNSVSMFIYAEIMKDNA